MFCIENEFQACIESIQSQTYQNYEYFIIENLPNKEAHDLLYSTFMNRADEFDLFMKVDADMVITRSSFFDEVIIEFSEDKSLDDLCISVYDFFTQKNIWGLHTYKKGVKWAVGAQEHLFVDRIDNAQKVKFINSPPLAPAALHCPNPSPFQAYHFGLHKGVKVIQVEQQNKNLQAGIKRLEDIESTIQNFRKNSNRMLGLAALASLIAINNRLSYKYVDFNSKESETLFRKLDQLSVKELKKSIREEKTKAAWFLPQNIRIEHFWTPLTKTQTTSLLPLLVIKKLKEITKNILIKVASGRN